MPIIDATLLALGLGAGLLACFFILMKRAEVKTDLGEAGNRGTFTIGPATTYLTGPVNETGHIDYVTALNDRLSAGVTARNNANVGIWEVLGPNPPGDGKIPLDFFDRMGMTAPPATGDYFVGLWAYCAGRDEVRRGQVRRGDYFVRLWAYCARHALGQLNAVGGAVENLSKRPWTADEHAVASGWLRANEKPLAALREAVKRSQYYHPLLPGKAEKGLSGAIFSGLTACRELAAALATRAMLQLGHGNASEAWQDLLTCHRLGRQIGRGGTLFEGLVGLAIEQFAIRGEIAFLGRARPDAETAERCLRDLFEIPKVRTAADQIDLAERTWALDTFMQFDRHGVPQDPLYDADFQPIKHGLTEAVLIGIDWNPALEFANTSIDRLAAIFREKDRATRVRKLTEMEVEMRPHYTRFVGGGGPAALKNAGSATERGRVLGQLLFASSALTFGKVHDASDRIRQYFDTVTVAYALAWYQRVNGQYPDSLAKLAPTYLKTVPGDVFSGKELIYRPHATGFLLYSVGVNGIDEGGRWADDKPPGDDIVVRIPQPPKP